MARKKKSQVWTPERRKAMSDKMKAKIADGTATPPPNPAQAEKTASPISQPHTATSPDAPQDVQSVAPVQNPIPTPASNEQDPQIAAKLAELDAAIKRTNELNEKLAQGEQERTATFDAGIKKLSPVENKQVIEVHKSKAQRMKEHLAKQEKVPVFIPLEGKEKMGTFLPVTLNGYRLNVPKGVYVQVPKQVQEEIMNSLNQTQAALDNKYNMDNADEKTTAALS